LGKYFNFETLYFQNTLGLDFNFDSKNVSDGVKQDGNRRNGVVGSITLRTTIVGFWSWLSPDPASDWLLNRQRQAFFPTRGDQRQFDLDLGKKPVCSNLMQRVLEITKECERD
jgi:hypothetical protein